MVISLNKNQLIYGRAIFILIITVLFGLIIINEKGDKIFLPKATNNIKNYISENYTEIKDTIEIKNIKYKNMTFTAKIVSKENKNLYFYITYKKRQIKDTYKKDFLEGNSLLNYLNNKIENEIYKKTNIKYNKVNAISTLDKYTNNVQKEIINENNLLTLKYYYLEKEIIIDNWEKETITNEIIKYIKINEENQINPKYYIFTIIDKNDKTKVLEISNINNTFITNNNKKQIIEDILNDNNSNLINDNNIKYEYLNGGK